MCSKKEKGGQVTKRLTKIQETTKVKYQKNKPESHREQKQEHRVHLKSKGRNKEQTGGEKDKVRK